MKTCSNWDPRHCHAEVQKTIIIENWKVGCLLRFLQFGVVCLVFFMVIVEEAWLREIPQADFQGGMTFYASSASNDEYTEKTNHDFMQDWCINPGKYDYQYDEGFAYKDHSCVGMPVHERWIKGETELFLPVSFIEKYMLQANFHKELIDSNGGSCEAALMESSPCVNKQTKEKQTWATLPRGLGLLGCECELSSGNFFVVGVSAVTLGMELFYHIQTEDDVKTEGFSTKDTTLENGVEETGLLVILRDQHGHKINEYQPGGGRAVSIPIADLMKHAGADLDEAMTNTIENVNKTAKTRYPTHRITGVTISVDITYMNTRSDHGTDWDGPVAIISLSHQKIWSTKYVIDHEKPLAQFVPSSVTSSQLGQYRYRVYSGISIKFSNKGIWKQTHMTHFFSVVGSSIPFFGIAVVFVSLFALNCLGPIGTIYSRAGRQRVGLKGHKGNAAVRMVIASNAYDQLKGSDPTFSKARLKDRMYQILQQSHLLDEEMSKYDDLIVQQMCGELDEDGSGDISLEEFMECAIGHELVGPKQLVDCHLQKAGKSLATAAFFSEGTRVSHSELEDAVRAKFKKSTSLLNTVNTVSATLAKNHNKVSPASSSKQAENETLDVTDADSRNGLAKKVPQATSSQRHPNFTPTQWKAKQEIVVRANEDLTSDEVQKLPGGIIVEQVAPSVTLPNGVVRCQIRHPSSPLFPAPIGWVTQDATANGGPRFLEPASGPTVRATMAKNHDEVSPASSSKQVENEPLDVTDADSRNGLAKNVGDLTVEDLSDRSHP